MCKTTFDNLNLINTNTNSNNHNHYEDNKKTLFMKNRDFF
jgi:hypothetical protein